MLAAERKIGDAKCFRTALENDATLRLPLQVAIQGTRLHFALVQNLPLFRANTDLGFL
jgi:hypothetical protein